MALPILFHPVLLFAYSTLTVTLTAAFTDRGSPLRYAAVVILCLLSTLSPYAVAQFTTTTGWAGRVPSGAMLWNCVTCADRLILRGWDYHHYGRSVDQQNASKQGMNSEDTPEQDARFPGSRMDFGSEASGQARGIERFWQVKNIPHFSEENPDLVPTPGAFVLVQAIAIGLCYFINNGTVAYTFSLDQRLLSEEYVPLLTRLSRITTDELQTRIITTIGYWVVQYCNLQFFYSLFGLLGAISNPSEIRLWRPLFGNAKDAYNLRDFWGKSWHQTMRSGFEGASNFVTHDVLHLPAHGALQRYTKIFASFALSGVMHVFADMGGGLTMQQSGALQFFCMQALGIMMEDGVKEAYKHLTNVTGRLPHSMERAIGYAWVLFFFVWTSPVWVFPATLQMKEEEAMLSLSALKPLMRWRSD